MFFPITAGTIFEHESVIVLLCMFEKHCLHKIINMFVKRARIVIKVNLI